MSAFSSVGPEHFLVFNLVKVPNFRFSKLFVFVVTILKVMFEIALNKTVVLLQTWWIRQGMS